MRLIINIFQRRDRGTDDRLRAIIEPFDQLSHDAMLTEWATRVRVILVERFYIWR